nr:mitochondrial mRNA pseudouridine synthase RPUSD3-like [Cherax quadricarinatus]
MMCYYGRVIKPHLLWEYSCIPTCRLATAVKHDSKTRSKCSAKEEKQLQSSKKFGLNRKEKRALKRRLLQDIKDTAKGHVFKLLYPWKTKLELAEHLKNTEVYNDGGLVALCKPYGIQQVSAVSTQTEGQQTIVQTVNSGGFPEHVPSVQDTLPVLKEMYGVSHLEVVKSTERWSSGLMLLSTNKKLTENVQKSLRRSKAFKQSPLTYWAVTVSLPRPTVTETNAAFTLEYVNNIGKVPVIMKNYSQAGVKRGEVKLSLVKHQILTYNKSIDAALVEVKTQSLKWHFLRVWLAHSYSPVLGDALYSQRVKMVVGKKLQISPHNLTAYEPQVIPEKLFSKLELPSQAVEIIPCHLHLAEVQLAHFNKDKSDLILSAPPPDFFAWTCKQLGLMSDEDDAAKADSK